MFVIKERNQSSLDCVLENFTTIILLISIKNNDHLHIHNFYVSDKIRSVGISGKMLQNLIHEINKTNIKKISLWIYGFNKSVEDFYKKNGFYLTGETKCINKFDTDFVLKAMEITI